MAGDKAESPKAEEKQQEAMTTEESDTTEQTKTDTEETKTDTTKETKETKEPEPGSSKDNEEKFEVTEERLKEAHAKLAQGKRDLLCGEIHNAIEALQTACEIYCLKYGETADELGEPYFFYGKARLELARMEAGVLGNALDGVPEEGDTEEEDTAAPAEPSDAKKPDARTTAPKIVLEKFDTEAERDEELAAQVYDAMFEKDGKTPLAPIAEDKADAEGKKDEPEKQDGESMEKDAKDKTETDKKDDETKEKKETEETKEAEAKKDETKETTEKKEGSEEMETEEAKGDAGEDTAEDEEGDDEEGDDDAEGESEKEEEDVSNIQLAWETLDIARVIFSRCKTKEMQLKAAQAHLKLGEVSLELEQNEQAIKDFAACLCIQQGHLEPDDRLLAETHYQLGVAYSYNQQYEEARKELKAALKTVADRKASLEKTIKDCGDDKEKETEKKTAEDELKDLAEIVPDIEAKIKDTEDEEKAMMEKAKMEATKIFEAAASGVTSSSCEITSSSTTESSGAAKVNVLVPRKRKPSEDPATEEDKDTKKARQENGSGDVTKGTNGADKTESNGVDKTAEKTAENGDGDKTSETEIKVKTVDEVLKAKEEANAKMDTA